MSDKSAKWLQEAIDNGIEEWQRDRAANQLPSPDTNQLAIYRLGFAAGADAALTYCAEVLTKNESMQRRAIAGNVASPKIIFDGEDK